MGETEKYFLILGIIGAIIVAYLTAQHNKTRGHSFWQTFIYGSIALSGLVFMAWKYFWHQTN